MVALTNETQTMLSFPRIFKFNAVIYYPFIIILQHREKKMSWIFICKIFKKYYYIYFMCKNNNKIK